MNKLRKVYIWFSGILVASLGTYITTILITGLPAPKDLLCSLSLGYCPPPTIEFSATDSERILTKVGVGQAPGQNQIGLLHGAVCPESTDPLKSVKYKVDADAPGDFDLKIYYASPDSRPVQISVNGDLLKEAETKETLKAILEATGGGDNDDCIWSGPYRVTLKAGRNELMFRANMFPHLSRFHLTKVK